METSLMNSQEKKKFEQEKTAEDTEMEEQQEQITGSCPEELKKKQMLKKRVNNKELKFENALAPDNANPAAQKKLLIQAQSALDAGEIPSL